MHPGQARLPVDRLVWMWTHELAEGSDGQHLFTVASCVILYQHLLTDSSIGLRLLSRLYQSYRQPVDSLDLICIASFGHTWSVMKVDSYLFTQWARRRR